MIGRLNHVAIAVGDIAKAAKLYRETLGAKVSGVVPQPDHGVNTVFITLLPCVVSAPTFCPMFPSNRL